jgi:hypothetical protein
MRQKKTLAEPVAHIGIMPTRPPILSERFRMTAASGGDGRTWFRKGNVAMGRQNWKFAVECFSNAIQIRPDVVLYRQTKHLCCRKLHGDNSTGAKMAGMRLLPIRSKAKKALESKDWAALDQHAEDDLVINPWDGPLFAAPGKACTEQDRGQFAAYA